ncbi:MAG: zf-HC2 domain-containing protein [Paenibacillaceae bacterium]|uniref:Anti-sigma-W factor RsiW n=1 Tax=Paenibacillus mellifer TaxID=2937794 RepID=A0A9X1Y5U4_9BACL|nr:zf-HC2 domain-containing protein [Paenibacillus mellifer]MBW4841073.1 zf-HC2 domain-containing protein [Paenibacillaceae bacterium]MCK8487927.1 zf-HC2 domain-containing protein [Paenibacillus mellifer]
MKCPEAVEWMHRYLDHDLNEEESFLLFEHIRNCEECAETFALLNKLSAQLEELPKVVPNYSLVDAILPQLDEIDRARLEGGSAAEETVLPMTAVHVEAGTGQGGTLLSRRSSRRQDADAGVRRSRIYRYGSLGVAAALILGVFIYQYEPRTVSDAEIAMNTSLTESASENSSAANSADDAAGSAQLFKDGSNAGSLEMGEQDAPVPKEDGNPTAGGNSGGADDQNDTGDLMAPVTPGAEPGNSQSGIKAPSEQDTGKSDPTSDNSVPTNQGDRVPAQDPTTPEAGNSDSAADAKAPEGLEDEIINRQLTLEDPMGKFGIASFNSWTSPDGKFEAELKDGHLYVYRLDIQDRKQVADEAIDGNWVDGAWSEDGRVFTYETEIDGTSAVRTIDAEKAAAAAAEETQP